MNKFEEELKRILEERKTSGAKFPPFYTFGKPGEYLIGTFRGTRMFDDEEKQRPIYTVQDLSGTTWSVGGTTVLRRLFGDVKPQPGDCIMISYEGEGKTKRGRRVKQFSLSKIPAEEMAQRRLKPAGGSTLTGGSPAIEKPSEEPPKVEKPSEEVKVEKPSEEPAKTEEPSEGVKELPQSAECHEFFSRMFDFYDEMPREDIEGRILKRFPKLTFDGVLEICGNFLEYDEKANKVRKKAK